jgi:hypothetical protein
MCSSFKTYYHGGTCAGILEQSMGAMNRLGIGLSYRPDRSTKAGGIDSLESISGILKSLKIPPLENSALSSL